MNIIRSELNIYFLLCYTRVILQCWSETEINPLTIIISSQSDPYHDDLSSDLRNNLLAQNKRFQVPLNVIILNKEFPHYGGWTLMILFPEIHERYHLEKSWYFFCEDSTQIDLELLLIVLRKYDVKEEIWIGHALYDKEATIIHHFALFDEPFAYPNFISGFAMSSKTLTRATERLKTRKMSDAEFSIDASHELAIFLREIDVRLTPENKSFCTKMMENCATYPRAFKPCQESKSLTSKSIYFAIKTCDKFHENRVRVMKETWAPFAENIAYYSNFFDKNIPTIDIKIPNTEHGHCEKTMAILHHVSKAIKTNLTHIEWIVLADDDTILSVKKIGQFLTCYKSSSLIILGERYGYNVFTNEGYNYITGGGGIVISKSLLFALTKPGICKCPSISSPDDMILGVCVSKIRAKVIHSPMFHQARPNDYDPGYLESTGAISFHKHWMIDPVQVYGKWFAEIDESLDKLDTNRSEL